MKLTAWPVALAFVCTAQFASPALESFSVESPDGAVRFRMSDLQAKSPAFEVTFRGKPVIEPSQLQFTLDGELITSGVEPGELKRYSENETYPWRGVHSIATNHYNGATLPLRHAKSDVNYSLEVRVFNDGAAFRFVIPGNNHARVPDENHSFKLPGGSMVWYHGENGHYEDVYQKKTLEEINAGEWAMPPVTFKLPNNAGYASITEAALVNYSGMALQADGHSGFKLALAHNQPASYPYRLRYSTNDVERLAHAAAISGTITSPWRVVTIGENLNALVNSDIIHNLCPPPDPDLFPNGFNTAWVKPGRAVWKYLDGGESTIEGTKEFCRLAGELGFEFNVIEGYWSRWTDEEIKDVVRYAKEHGVGLWFWKHSKSLQTAQAREEFFSKLQKLGVVGAKIDFFDHEHKEVIDLYYALLREAARHRVLLNFHGANKPTGESRTWPNELTREAVKGMEASKLADRATHDATLPFTRYLAGHGDYTVLHFGARRANTTWAHQIATAAIFNQPLHTYAAHPERMLTNAAVELIKSIPATWDETIVLPQSEIGECAVFARRVKSTWFLAALNGTTARTLQIPLSFLNERPYRALMVRDRSEEQDAVTVETTSARRADSLKIQLSSGGGFVARFEVE